MTVGEEIRVRGMVQGVGFRPAVWRHAHERALSGDVCNDNHGVLIRVWGDRGAVDSFVQSVCADAPPLARIDSLERRVLTGPPAAPGFRILPSAAGAVHTTVIPDAASCAECVGETMLPGSRRFGYAFTNCAHCGPRLTIVAAIPYDRDNTSLAAFRMCDACRAEYDDPGDRRFHAQPIACPNCGPRLWLEPGFDDDPLEAARRLLREGSIVAIKGLGGFHVACDATNAQAVAALRRRKRRERKPFALMAPTIDMIARYCTITAAERALLLSRAAPIVICDATGPQRLPDAIAPGLRTLGFMLPYSPLHHLLLRDFDAPIVLTSGNVTDAPQCTDNADARARLDGVVDAWLLHDREIVTRVDDSVVAVRAGAPRVVRRARGYAPAPLPLPAGFERAPAVLAMGGELKNTFCLVTDGHAVLSQHQGDLEYARTFADYRRGLDLYRRIFDHAPDVVAVDLHPDYLSTRVGHELAAGASIIAGVQHHHAHIASCMAENGVALTARAVLGVALDGLGMGERGELWGGEFLLADYRGFRRLARMKPVALPGGVRAIRQPWRSAYAHIEEAIGAEAFQARYPELALARFFDRKGAARLDAMLASGLASPRASSCGRLFDAVAAAVGICRDRVSYEGQAAIELEALATRDSRFAEHAGYPFELAEEDPGGLAAIDPGPMWRALLDDLSRDVARRVIAARFHRGLAAAIVAMVERCARRTRTRTVALSGGVFHNRLLLDEVNAALCLRGYRVLTHRKVPAGDGGLSLGQAAIAAALAIDRGGSTCA